MSKIKKFLKRMPKRREAQSSALSFMDCICCGFGAVLLLFILTAKRQMILSEEDASQSLKAAETLQAAIEDAKAQQKSLDKDISALAPQPDTNATSIAALAADQERLAKEVEAAKQKLASLESPEPEADPASLDRPSADRSYLSGLKLRGPRTVILLENSGSMLASSAAEAVNIRQQGTGKQSEKWLRAKAAVRAVLAAIPKGTRVALFQMNTTTNPISGNQQNPYIDPYDNAALIATLEQLEKLEAGGGANLQKAINTILAQKERPNSMLLMSDGLPTQPTSRNSLSETDRVVLFKAAVNKRFTYPVNVILFPFEGDPSAAGLYWQLSTRTNGVTLIPDKDWPPL